MIVILFLSVVARGSSQTDAKKAKHYALYAPRPQYPLEARKHHWTGSGLVGCNIRSDGTAASVDVIRSTGHQMLDQAAITAFLQWRFQPGDKLVMKKLPAGLKYLSRRACAFSDRFSFSTSFTAAHASRNAGREELNVFTRCTRGYFESEKTFRL